jgi:hypothetical protein
MIEIMNIRAGVRFRCICISPHVSRILLYTLRGESKIGYIVGSKFYQMRIIVPGKSWSINVSKPKAMYRCNKLNTAEHKRTKKSPAIDC